MTPTRTILALGLLAACAAVQAPAAWACGDEAPGGGGGPANGANGADGGDKNLCCPTAPNGTPAPATPGTAPGLAPPRPAPGAPNGMNGMPGMNGPNGMNAPGAGPSCCRPEGKGDHDCCGPGGPDRPGMDGDRRGLPGMGDRRGPDMNGEPDMDRGDRASRRPKAAKQLDLVIKPLYNLGDQKVYTMFGFENLRAMPGGWSGGYATYHGLNLGNAATTDLLGHGGFLAKKRLLTGALDLEVGGLLGMGYTLSATPTLGFSNFGIFAGLEPRVVFTWHPHPGMGVQLGATYLITTRPAQASGPAIMLGLAYGLPFWGR